jgi:hypothetical protein
MPTNVAAIMPPHTGTPRARLLPAPAPVARTGGNTPIMNASAVIGTGRSRCLAPSVMALLRSQATSAFRRC